MMIGCGGGKFKYHPCSPHLAYLFGCHVGKYPIHGLFGIWLQKVLNINHFQPDEAAIHAATAPVAFAKAPAVRAPQMVGVNFVRPFREPTHPTKREVGTIIPLKGVLGWDGIC